MRIKELWEDMEDAKVAEMRQEIAREHGWHLDDDGDRIDNELHCRLEEEREREELPSSPFGIKR